MPNPFFSNKTSPNGATAPNDSLNESSKRYFRGYNRFNLTRQFYNTERYADINLIEVLEGVEGDNLPFGNKHDIRTFTMKSPIMFDVYKKKTYFAVNNLAILPNNWKKVYKQPNKGDDVEQDVNCVSMMLSYIENFLNVSIQNPLPETRVSFNYYVRVLLLLESIFSNGSLLSSMNCHLSNLIKVSDGSSFDSWLEETYSSIPFLNVRFNGLSSKYFHMPDVNNDNAVFVSRRNMFDYLRSISDFDVIYVNADSYSNIYNYIISRIQMLSFRYSTPEVSEDFNILNLSRLIAYQLVCNQFYTRDSVDNIYSAELFLQNAKDVIKPTLGVTTSAGSNFWPTFDYNGSRIEYDVFSGHVIDLAFDYFFNYIPLTVTQAGASIDETLMKDTYSFFHMIFFYRKSLRYGDYFVGGKTLPYAPMDVTADVVGNGVSALDMTRSIIAQRFANAVERVSNTWKDYLKGVTGGNASPDPYEPRFLASSTSSVNGFEVENTAENQGNIVTILRSHNSNYVYEMTVDEPCIIIGVSTYEVPRVYSATVDRFFKHTDRFNMFNKFFQNIGDQEITQNERNAGFSPLLTFAYTPRHMEYKQRYPYASGGFINDAGLSGYAFITDNNESGQNELDLGTDVKISSFYLRNRNSEFDRFYSSLTGLTLASYFHFIVKYDLICHARRQMEYSPSIL